MADETLRFDIVGEDNASGAFSRAGASAGELSRHMDIAAQTAKVLDDALKRQQQAGKAAADGLHTAERASALLAVTERELDKEIEKTNRALAKPMEVQILTAKAAAKIDDIRLRADKLKATFPEFTAKIDDTAYKLKLAAMAAEAKVTGDLIARELSGGGAGGRVDPLNRLIGTAGSGPLGSVGPVPVAALPAIVPAIGAALVELTGLVSGFAAATAGAGSFALLAVPAVKKVETAYTNLNTAQQAYQLAQAKEAVDPTKANQAAVTRALDNLKAQQKLLSGLPASEQAAVTGIQGLVTQFGKLSTAFQPEAFKVFSAGLQLVDKLLPDIVPFAKTFADVVTTLLTQASKFSQTKGFTDFLAQFHGIEGPAIAAIGDGIGKVAIAVGKLLTTMSGKDVANSINIAFTIIAGAINTVSYVVKTLMKNWDQMSATAKRATHDTAAVFDTFRHGTATTFDGIRGDIAKAWNTIWLNTVTRVQNGIADVVRFFTQMPGKIVSALGNAKTTLLSWGAGVITGLLQGMTSVITQVWDFIKGIPGKILKFLGITSPPQWAIDAGKHIMNGLGIGMNQAQAVFTKASAASAKAAAAAATGALGTGGVSNASGVAALKSAAAKHGWTSAAEWAALNNVEMREAGYSLTATNPSSGAYGMAQFINGPSEYAQYGGNSTTYAGQATAMANYIAQRYGDPIAAWAHEQAYGWYDRGGWLPTGLSLALNTTGSPEMVGGQDSLVAELRALRAEVRQLTGVAAAIPARTGQHVGSAIGGAAAQGSFGRRYP